VASDWQHRGLGRMLMDKLLAYLRARGTAEVFGQCLPENQGMAALAREEGFAVHMDADHTMHMRLRLPTPH
jgi:acetyltransferase